MQPQPADEPSSSPDSAPAASSGGGDRRSRGAERLASRADCAAPVLPGEDFRNIMAYVRDTPQVRYAMQLKSCARCGAVHAASMSNDQAQQRARVHYT
jgi:hypothetical protein